MTRADWIHKAAEKLKPYLGEGAPEYAASLYVTYVEEDSAKFYADDPDSAVTEDMDYWE